MRLNEPVDSLYAARLSVFNSPVPCIAAATFASAITIGNVSGHLRVRQALAGVILFSLVALVFAVVGRQNGFRPTKNLALSFAVFVAGLLTAMVVQRTDYGNDSYWLALELSTWLLGWSLYVFATAGNSSLPGAAPFPHEPVQRSSSPARNALVIGATSLIVLMVVGALVAGRATLIIDDTLYVMQARLFHRPDFSLPVDPSLQQFFLLRQSAYRSGGMFSQYSPGWPAILALFDAAGLIRWAGAALGAGAVALTYLLGRRLHSSRVGTIAAALLLLHPLYLHSSNIYGSHGATTFFLLLVAFLAVGDRSSGRLQVWRWAAIGASLGAAFAIRPLTTVALGGSLAIWYYLRTRPSPGRLLTAALITICGALPALVATGLYNSATTGSPFEFGYAAAMGELHALGFGQRGFLTYNQNGVARVVGVDFSLRQAISNHVAVMWSFSLTALPTALLLPVMTASAACSAIRWRTVVSFALLPVAYFFWFYSTPRFYVDALPYLFLAIALAFERMRLANPMLARNLTILLWMLVPAAAVAGTLKTRAIFSPCRQTYDAIEQYGAAQPSLIFVKDPPTQVGIEMILECAFVFNTRGLDGPVVVARDLGASNVILMKRYPEHRALRVRWDAGRSTTVFEQLLP